MDYSNSSDTDDDEISPVQERSRGRKCPTGDGYCFPSNPVSEESFLMDNDSKDNANGDPDASFGYRNMSNVSMSSQLAILQQRQAMLQVGGPCI